MHIHFQVELTDREFEKLLVEEEKQKKDGKKKKKKAKQRRYSRCPRSRILNRKNDRMSKADESGDEVNLLPSCY